MTSIECDRRAREMASLFEWKCVLVQTLWETIRNYLMRLKIPKSFDLAIPLLSMCCRKSCPVIAGHQFKTIHSHMVPHS